MLITVDPDAWYAASTKFGANVARTLSDAESALGATLADSGRIAGNDPSGAAWAQAYDQTAPAVAQAINDAVAAALTVSGLLRQTGLNHASADADSNALGAMLQAPIAVDAPTFGVCVSVPSVAGGSLGPPNGWLDIQNVCSCHLAGRRPYETARPRTRLEKLRHQARKRLALDIVGPHLACE